MLILMHIFAFEVLNLYSINSPSHIGQTTLDSIFTILIFVPILSFFPPIFLKHFGSDRDRLWRVILIKLIESAPRVSTGTLFIYTVYLHREFIFIGNPITSH